MSACRLFFRAQVDDTAGTILAPSGRSDLPYAFPPAPEEDSGRRLAGGILSFDMDKRPGKTPNLPAVVSIPLLEMTACGAF